MLAELHSVHIAELVLRSWLDHGDGKFSKVAVGIDTWRIGWNRKLALNCAVPLVVWAGCPSVWIVAVYVAAPAAAFGPPSKKDPDQHNRDPPE